MRAYRLVPRSDFIDVTMLLGIFITVCAWFGGAGRQLIIVNTLQLVCARYLEELIEKQEANDKEDFYLYKILRAHILPLTNCAFNKSGDKYVLDEVPSTLA